MTDVDRRSLAWLTERYVDHLAERGYAALTVKDRRGKLAQFRSWAEERGLRLANEVTPAILTHYRAHLFQYRKTDGAPLSWNTQANRLACVKRLFVWLTRTGRLLSDPAAALELPKAPKRLPRTVLTAAEAERVMEAPDLSTAQGVRDRAILETLYSTGIRRSELAHLALQDLDAERGILRIREGKGAKDRYVPIGDRAVLWIRRYLFESRGELLGSELDRGALFLTRWGRAFSPNSLTVLASDYITNALGKDGACHVFRHTAATLMHDAGADVRYLQEMLGHEDLSSTQIYTRVSIARLKEIHTRTHPARLPKKTS